MHAKKEKKKFLMEFCSTHKNTRFHYCRNHPVFNQPLISVLFGCYGHTYKDCLVEEL